MTEQPTGHSDRTRSGDGSMPDTDETPLTLGPRSDNGPDVSATKDSPPLNWPEDLSEDEAADPEPSVGGAIPAPGGPAVPIVVPEPPH